VTPTIEVAPEHASLELRTLSFVVLGAPAPKGSKRIVQPRGAARAFMIDDNKKTKPWARLVSTAAMIAMRDRGVPMWTMTALDCQIVFARARPAGHYGKSGKLKKSAPHAPLTKPDGDKLQRSTHDALEGIVFDNDSRICGFVVDKIFAPAGISPGAYVRLNERSARVSGHVERLYAMAVRASLGESAVD
jgi:Holliday junction resolvase RusA-like endonuclease